MSMSDKQKSLHRWYLLWFESTFFQTQFHRQETKKNEKVVDFFEKCAFFSTAFSIFTDLEEFVISGTS